MRLTRPAGPALPERRRCAAGAAQADFRLRHELTRADETPQTSSAVIALAWAMSVPGRRMQATTTSRGGGLRASSSNAAPSPNNCPKCSPAIICGTTGRPGGVQGLQGAVQALLAVGQVINLRIGRRAADDVYQSLVHPCPLELQGRGRVQQIAVHGNKQARFRLHPGHGRQERPPGHAPRPSQPPESSTPRTPWAAS